MSSEELHAHFLECSAPCTDTRNMIKDSMFFALKGATFNGNAFAQQALDSGCKYAVVDEEVGDDPRLFKVDNVLKVLQDLAKVHRSKLSTPVFGLTGSNGKTTTKELIRDVLAMKFKVFATKGNLNNHIGVPLSILSIKPEYEIAIIEMGASAVGEIALLSSIADPDAGLITNIGRAHLEGFGGMEGVIKGKTELYKHLMQKEGLVFVNAGDETLKSELKNYTNVKTYGINTGDVLGSYQGSNPYIEFSWRFNDYQSGNLKTNLIGEYNFINCLAALAVGVHYNVPPQDAEQAIVEFVSDNNRSEVREGRNTVILDAYNANPTSMRAAIENFARMSGTKLAILGDMLEVGETSEREHVEIAEMLTDLNIPSIFVGKEFKKALSDGDYQCYASREDLEDDLKAMDLSDHKILLKGSRGIRLEPLADLLV